MVDDALIAGVVASISDRIRLTRVCVDQIPGKRIASALNDKLIKDARAGAHFALELHLARLRASNCQASASLEVLSCDYQREITRCITIDRTSTNNRYIVIRRCRGSAGERYSDPLLIADRASSRRCIEVPACSVRPADEDQERLARVCCSEAEQRIDQVRAQYYEPLRLYHVVRIRRVYREHRRYVCCSIRKNEARARYDDVLRIRAIHRP